MVNGWKPLTVITKSSILDIVAVLDPPLMLRACLFNWSLTVKHVKQQKQPGSKRRKKKKDFKVIGTPHNDNNTE